MPLIPLSVVLIGLILFELENNQMLKKIWRISIAILLSVSVFLSFSGLILMIFAKFAAIPKIHSKNMLKIFNGISEMNLFLIFIYFLIFLYTVKIAYSFLVKNKKSNDNLINLLVYTSLIVAIVLLHYCSVRPVIQQFEYIRSSEKLISSSVPKGEVIYLYKVGCEPFLFYMKNPFEYIELNEIKSNDVKYVMFPDEFYDELAKKVKFQKIASFKQKKTTYQLVSVRSY